MLLLRLLWLPKAFNRHPFGVTAMLAFLIVFRDHWEVDNADDVGMGLGSRST
jgi:hypothetical protein